MVRTLVTGASGYIGNRLVRELHARGISVGCVARDPGRISFDPAVKVHRADMLDPSSLSAIGEGYTTAYYLQPRPFEQALREAITEEDQATGPTP